MTAKRAWILLMALLVVVFGGLIGATYGISKTLKAKSLDLADSKAQVQQLSAQQTGLTKSKQDIARYTSLEAITKSIVPQDKDQAQAVLELTNIAAANKISLTTINFPSSSLGALTTTNTKAAAAAAAKATPNLSQLTPVKNIPGVYNLQITIGNNGNNTVTFTQLDAFLRGLENNRRTAAVSSLSIQPQAGSSNRLVFTLVINTYIKPL